MSTVVLDDLLLRDVLGDTQSSALAALLEGNEWATTNLYQFRLCRGVVAPRVRRNGVSPQSRNRVLRAYLAQVRDERVIPMPHLSFRMAELVRDHPISTLGAEAVAAAESHAGVLCVAASDDGPNISRCCDAVGVGYHVVRDDG